MIVLLNQQHQHLELKKKVWFFFSKSDGNYDYNQKKDLSNKIIEDIKKIVVVNINKKVIVIENML